MKTAPHTIFKTRVRDKTLRGDNPFRWHNLSTDTLFTGKRIVVFALPGAFTPTCSSTHLPGYEKLYDEIINQDIDDIYCLSVNDAFVMYQWAKSLDIHKVKMLPDGNAEFTRKMGMLVKKDNLGFGMRSWRYSMVVNEGLIERIFVEPGFSDNCATDPFEVSDAETMLEYLKI